MCPFLRHLHLRQCLRLQLWLALLLSITQQAKKLLCTLVVVFVPGVAVVVGRGREAMEWLLERLAPVSGGFFWNR